ncbi:MAG: MMPL family transporter [Candidatus Hodarchaeota archaeon]
MNQPLKKLQPLEVASHPCRFESNTSPSEMDRFVSTPDYTNATLTVFFREYNNQIIKDAIAKVKDYVHSHSSDQFTFRLAGGIIGILAAVNEEVEWFYWVNLALIFSLTFLLCSMTFRSFLTAFILIIPLAVSQILSELLMLIGGIDLNINLLPVAAVGVGVGVDYGIYVMSRLAEEYSRADDYIRARYLAITSTRKAVVFTATTLVAGVIFWVFSSFKFQAEMGVLLAFLMVANMVGALVILPGLVSIFGPKRVLARYKI